MSKLEPTVAELIEELSRVKSAATTDLDPGSSHPSDMPKEEGGQHDASTGAYYEELTKTLTDNHDSTEPLTEKQPEASGTSDAEMANQDGSVTGADPKNERPDMDKKPNDLETGTTHEADISKLAVEDLLRMAKEAEEQLASGESEYDPKQNSAPTTDEQVKQAAAAGYNAAGSKSEEADLQKAAAANVLFDVQKQASEDADRLAHFLLSFQQDLKKEAEALPPEGEVPPGAGMPPEAAMPPEAMPPEAGLPPEGGMPPEAGMGEGEPSEEEAIQALLMALEESGLTIEDLLAMQEAAPQEMGGPEQIKAAAEQCVAFVKSGKYTGDRRKARPHVREKAAEVIDELVRRSRGR